MVTARSSFRTLAPQQTFRTQIFEGLHQAYGVGMPVILPGGEVGILKAWWNDDIGQEWRWSVEFATRTRKPLKGLKSR